MGLVGDTVQRQSAVRKIAQFGAAAFSCLALANCTTTSTQLSSRIDPKYGVSASPRVVEPGQPVPKGGGVYRVGRPYQVAGRTYTPEENSRYRNEGLASWYGNDFHGRLTANGEIYDMEAISAAHPTMPMPSYARVTNLTTNKSLIVRVNDRGPYHANREIDVSAKAADLLGFKRSGTARVRVEYVGAAPLQGTDDRQLIATLRDGHPAPAPVMVASNRLLPSFNRAPTRDVPLPQERPYDLGERYDRVATNYPQRQTGGIGALAAEALSRHPIDPRLADVSPDTEPPRQMAARLRSAESRGLASADATSGGRGDAYIPQPPTVSPVTGYAPSRIQGSVALSNGRGLY